MNCKVFMFFCAIFSSALTCAMKGRPRPAALNEAVVKDRAMGGSVATTKHVMDDGQQRSRTIELNKLRGKIAQLHTCPSIASYQATGVLLDLFRKKNEQAVITNDFVTDDNDQFDRKPGEIYDEVVLSFLRQVAELQEQKRNAVAGYMPELVNKK